MNKKRIIIYCERQDNAIRYMEVVFHERNYQHLTGLELIDKKRNVLRNQSINFYRKCIKNKLGLEETFTAYEGCGINIEGGEIE